MSSWTHIIAALEVDTYKESRLLLKYAEKVLSLAPKITGSEENAFILVNNVFPLKTHNFCECQNCEYQNTRTVTPEGEIECDADIEFECPDAHFSDRIIITVVGDLRDREIMQTKNEWENFIKYICNHDWRIIKCACKITT